MWNKLDQLEKRFEELAHELSSPEIVSNRQLYQKYSKEHKSLGEIVATLRSYRKAKQELDGSTEMMESGDPELISMAKEEIALLQKEIGVLEEELKFLLLPKDPNDEKNVILEIRAGTGGDEASIFVGDLLRMYTIYAEARNWKLDLVSCSDGTAGGFKEVIATVSGNAAFSRLKFERGVHRVQRVPKTETMGRIHTSTVTVAVLPEAEEVDLEIKESERRIEAFRSGGAGGQGVNTTDSAVRLTHIPTGVVVVMQDARSQHKNREKALQILRARLLEAKENELNAQRTADRRSQVGTGERSEKIRTYNYPQSRVTDHRIGLTLHCLSDIMNGELDCLIDPLIQTHQAELLKNQL